MDPEAISEEYRRLIDRHRRDGGSLPLIAGKIAMTLDGCAATRSGKSKWITGEEARRNVMGWRRCFSAIAVGAGTVLADDPALTSRLGDEVCTLRIIIDRRLRTFREPLPRIYSDAHSGSTVVFTDREALLKADRPLATRIGENGVSLIFVPDDEGAEYWSMLRQLFQNMGLESVFIEGGPTLFADAFKYGALDYLFAYQAPKIMGDPEAKRPFGGSTPESMEDVHTLSEVRHEVFGPDVLTRGFLKKPSKKGS